MRRGVSAIAAVLFLVRQSYQMRHRDIQVLIICHPRAWIFSNGIANVLKGLRRCVRCSQDDGLTDLLHAASPFGMGRLLHSNAALNGSIGAKLLKRLSRRFWKTPVHHAG
jgi:hypothetical protein